VSPVAVIPPAPGGRAGAARGGRVRRLPPGDRVLVRRGRRPRRRPRRPACPGRPSAAGVDRWQVRGDDELAQAMSPGGSDKHPDVTVRRRVVRDRPGPALLRYAQNAPSRPADDRRRRPRRVHRVPVRRDRSSHDVARPLPGDRGPPRPGPRPVDPAEPVTTPGGTSADGGAGPTSAVGPPAGEIRPHRHRRGGGDGESWLVVSH
jgi:hypothetical protein